MILQSVIFYAATVYGGVADSLSQNAADILDGRLRGRVGELETLFNGRWTELDDCVAALNGLYSQYEDAHGDRPLAEDPELQISFLRDSADSLIDTLRFSEANGVFLIVNDSRLRQANIGEEHRYGLCIRDMDQSSNYSGTEDLLLERGPSSLVDSLNCSLDSWWEARYSFLDRQQGDYYYEPVDAAWNAPKAKGKDLAYLSFVHQLSGSDPEVLSYSIPLTADDGYPYAVLGTELSVKYLASLLPSRELSSEADSCCYILAMQTDAPSQYRSAVSSGVLFSRCFNADSVIALPEKNETGGYDLAGRDGSALYVRTAELDVYNNNNPFSARRLVLLAVVETEDLFSYVAKIKTTLLLMSLLSLMLGMLGLTLVSRRFAAPITALAEKVRGMDATRADPSLGRLGITEIDQLVDSIEELNRNVSRNSARTEFFSRMSHDMRTPMNAIISFSSEELLENADEAVKDDYLGKIHASGIYLLGLINEVLDMTKIEQNKTELHIAPVAAARLFDTTVPVIEKLAQKKALSFTYDIRLPEGLRVMADEQHINQVVMNLLSNAVKFTPEGGRVVMEAGMEGEGALRLCRITVADTGVGMSPEFLARLYSPFAQENSGGEGTGLGLSIAKKLVELMDGTIDCQSRQGEGTTFTVTLPLAVTERVVHKAAAERDMPSLKGKRILLCEDNSINSLIVVNLLQRVGMTADVAENGRLGVERFSQAEKGTYSAILMDIRMPVMDGLTATRAIRALDREDAADIPIIAMTADAFAEDAATSLAAGMNEHLSKPVESQKLYDALKRHIK